MRRPARSAYARSIITSLGIPSRSPLAGTIAIVAAAFGDSCVLSVTSVNRTENESSPQQNLLDLCETGPGKPA